MTDLTIFREYEPHELGRDDYPEAWHRGFEIGPDGSVWIALAGHRGVGVKDLVRAQAEHRCERCGHPYVVGESGTIESDNTLLPAGDADALHAHRTERETGFPQGALDAAFEGRIADGKDAVEPGEGRRTHWSPCDERCTHGGPARARVTTTRPWEARPDASIDQLKFALEQGNEVQAAWRILTVHHLNGRKHDLRWWNLAALCQRCHLSVQTRVQMERVYPLEHTDWFKPHAAGWYGYAYLGENLTREEAVERQDELLALERAA